MTFGLIIREGVNEAAAARPRRGNERRRATGSASIGGGWPGSKPDDHSVEVGAQTPPEVRSREVRRPEREEPYRTAGAVHPLRRALVCRTALAFLGGGAGFSAALAAFT